MQHYQLKGRECLFYILRQWKKIIVGALLIGLALGAFRGFKTYRSWDKDAADIVDLHRRYDEYIDYYDQTIAMYQDDIADTQDSLADYSAMLGEAAFLRYDENAIGIAQAELYFSSTTGEALSDGTIELFSNVLNNELDWEKVKEAGNVETTFPDELLVVTQSENSNNVLSLKFFAEDDAMALAMLNEILSQADDVKAELNAQVGGFEYSVVGLSAHIGRDEDFITMKAEVQDKFNDIQNHLNTVNQALEELAGPPELREMPTAPKIALSIVKHFVFGCVVGVPAMAAIFYFLFYLNGMLHSSEELSYYSEAITMAYDATGKSRFAKINRFIAKKENRGVLYSMEDAIARTASNIKAKYPDVKKVIFTGVSSEDAMESIKKSLSTVKDTGITFKTEKDILTDKATFDSLNDSDAVVIVERLDKVSIALIKKEIEQIRIAGKEVVGTLIVR